MASQMDPSNIYPSLNYFGIKYVGAEHAQHLVQLINITMKYLRN